MMFSIGVPALLLHACMRCVSHVMFRGERGLSMHLGINALLVLSGDELVRLFMCNFLITSTSNLNTKCQL